jgi:hypothetical protein
MSRLVAARERMGIMGEFVGYLWRQKLWWMIPMFGVVAVFGLLMVAAQSSAIAPFIYTLF